MRGTSIGRSGDQPWGWIIRHEAPSISTVSPASRPVIWARLALARRPRHRLLAHHEPAREAGPERHGHPARREAGEGGGGGRRDHRVAERGHRHSGAEADARRRQRALGELHPDVAVEGGGVVDPGSVVAELLGETNVIDHIRAGGEGTRELHRRNVAGGILRRLSVPAKDGGS